MTRNFAHRGFRAQYPENTMLAFRKAAEAGCDGIELDVHISKDGEAVIIHDEDVRRTTNGSGLVKDMTLAELKALDAGEGESIPTLEEYFNFAENLSLITNIELKNNLIPYKNLEEKVIEMIRQRRMERRIILSSFNHDSVISCKQIAPEIPCGFICGKRIDNPGEYMGKHGVEFLHPFYKSLTGDFLEEIKQGNIPVNVWTVNDEKTMEQLLEQKVAGIFTDDPKLLREVMNRRNKS